MAITPAILLGGFSTNSGTSIVCGLTGSTSAGSCIVVTVFLQDNTKTVTSFNDDSTGGPMTFLQRSALNVTGGRLEQWSTAFNGGKVGASFITVNFSGTTEAAARVEECSGVLALGTTATANNTTANPSIALTTQDANNYVLAGFGLVGATTPTALTGTLRGSNASAGTNPVVASSTDNTAASASSVTNAVTRAAATWAAAAIELRSVSAGGAIPAIAGVLARRRRVNA